MAGQRDTAPPPASGLNGEFDMRVPAIFALVVGATAPLALADVVQLGASHDNTMYANLPGNSNGVGPGFFAGATATGAVRRGLISFDIAAAVPSGSTITGATLHLHNSGVQNVANSLSLYRLNESWGESTSNGGVNGGDGAPAASGDATWTHRFYNTTLWTTAGGAAAASPSATSTVLGAGFYDWTGPGLVADVQAWFANPSNNFGWLVAGTEATPGSAKRLDSRDNADPTVRPMLEITYTAVPAPGGLAALALAGIAAARRRRR